jgi:hypothetical protein
VLRRISGPKREKMRESWRRLHNEELHNLYVSPNIIRVIKLSGIGWTRHVADMGEMTHTILRSENLKERDHSLNLDVDGKIIL